MKTEDLMSRFCNLKKPVVAFVDMKEEVPGIVLPLLGRGDGADVVCNKKHVAIFLLNDKLRSDPHYALEVLRRADVLYPVSQDAHRLGLTTDQLVLLHMVMAVELGHVAPCGPSIFRDSFGWWDSWAGRRMWLYTSIELDNMSVGKEKGSDCSPVGKQNNHN